MADGNMVQNTLQSQENHPNGDGDAWQSDDDSENCNDAEYEAINAQLDQLNSALDSIERKNDDIQAELVELLQSNREARKQFQQSKVEHSVDLPKSDV